ncbi:uncharacterized protein BKA55DRAFT_572001 [Fusarium redolens]|uniref:Uncharacterized protein n=1 Tax=Fusarium redolens TaxID=48865 RepID=A0A9P9GXU5_FUSRE|nr:uncharacterized protein BKA55DRAFT_572001 [Fusarium redolens]KAH7247488.1 hypothetical protein BKA55DRAFT_572001 [Fusarium redolens]
MKKCPDMPTAVIVSTDVISTSAENETYFNAGPEIIMQLGDRPSSLTQYEEIWFHVGLGRF